MRSPTLVFANPGGAFVECPRCGGFARPRGVLPGAGALLRARNWLRCRGCGWSGRPRAA